MTDKSTNPFGEELGSKQILASQGAILMIKGAGYGAVLFFGVLIFIWVLAQIGELLPPESREMPDPTPTSQIILPGGDTIRPA